MSSLNRVTLIGRLGKDPEVRYTRSQTPFARFSLATSETFTTNGEKREKTEWHNIVVWGKQAEIAGRYLRKGKQIYLEGRIEYREYDDQNGQRRYITDIRTDRFIMLGSPSDSPGGYGPRDGGYPPPREEQGASSREPEPMSYGGPSEKDDVPESDDFNDDDIPF